jgi:hypothetical protein
MTNEDEDISLESLKIPEEYKKIGLGVIAAIVILTGITIMAYRYAKGRASTTVLPGGTTYLGPDRSTTPAPTQPPSAPSKFTVNNDTTWIDHKGKVFPYTISIPSTLSIVTFPKDVTDSIAISWGDSLPQNNIFLRVSDLNKTESAMSKYIDQPKIEYAKNWWKQWSGYKSLKSIEQFTNSKGSVGYKVKYLNTAGESPNDYVFMEVPDRPDLMVYFGNGYLDKPVFDRIVDSFAWKSTTVKSTTKATPAQ